MMAVKFRNIQATVWKFQKFTLTLFWQKFRECNDFTKEVSKELILRNIFQVREIFPFFHTVRAVWKIQKFSLTEKNIS